VLDGPNGYRYEGDFNGGLPSGRGVIVWGERGRYEGAVRKALMHGQGIFTSSNGDAYEGGFVDGKQDGIGKCRSGKSGEWQKCEWKMGQIVGWPD
jgi:hypothetical protein